MEFSFAIPAWIPMLMGLIGVLLSLSGSGSKRLVVGTMLLLLTVGYLIGSLVAWFFAWEILGFAVILCGIIFVNLVRMRVSEKENTPVS